MDTFEKDVDAFEKQCLKELNEFLSKPTKTAYVFLDKLLHNAYHPETFDIVGECDFYNRPKDKGYVVMFNGLLYEARLDKSRGEDVGYTIPKRYDGYYLKVHKNHRELVRKYWQGS